MLKPFLKTARKNFQDIILKPESIYRFYLERKYRIDGPVGYPGVQWENKVLKTREELLKATEQVRALKLPSRSDSSKNWDTLAALSCILQRERKEAVILDAGAELYSMILPWLFLHGYKNLKGINLVFNKNIKRGPILYGFGDITKTEFPANTFDAISCLSVIEHGVDLAAYFREMSRILKPEGILITSTDYYESPIDTKGQKAYGVPIHIFSREEIISALETAKINGLRLTSPLDLDCHEKPVQWQRFSLKYTYLVFTMQKKV